MRDKDKLFDYIKSLSPFPKEVEQKLFKSSKDITLSVIYGQVFIGMLQGLITAIGFFIFGEKGTGAIEFLKNLCSHYGRAIFQE